MSISTMVLHQISNLVPLTYQASAYALQLRSVF